MRKHHQLNSLTKGERKIKSSSILQAILSPHIKSLKQKAL